MRHATCHDCGACFVAGPHGTLPHRCGPCHAEHKRKRCRAYWAKLPDEERRTRWREASRNRMVRERRIKPAPPCGDCGVELGPRKGPQRFCRACRAKRDRAMRRAIRANRPPRPCIDCGAPLVKAHGGQRYCVSCGIERTVTRDRVRKQAATASVFSHPKVSDGEFMRRVEAAEARERQQEEARLARLHRRCDCGGIIAPGTPHRCMGRAS